MAYQRVAFPSRMANLAFSIEKPEGFDVIDFPSEECDFNNPTFSAPLGFMSSSVAVALLTVAARPAYEDGSVMDWLRYLTDHFGITLKTLMPGRVGGATHWHQAILAHGEQTQEGTLLQLRIASFEDGGRLVTVHGFCPAELAPSYMPMLEHCVQSIELAEPQGPTAPLAGDLPVPALEAVG